MKNRITHWQGFWIYAVTLLSMFLQSHLSVQALSVRFSFAFPVPYDLIILYIPQLIQFLLVHISISLALSLSLSPPGTVEVWPLITIINYSLLFLPCATGVIFPHSSFSSGPLIRCRSISDAEAAWLHLSGHFRPDKDSRAKTQAGNGICIEASSLYFWLKWEGTLFMPLLSTYISMIDADTEMAVKGNICHADLWKPAHHITNALWLSSTWSVSFMLDWPLHHTTILPHCPKTHILYI